MAAPHWLLKAEPEPHIVKGRDVGSQPFSSLTTRPVYDGVRNFAARNTIRDSIKVGHEVFFYHSSTAVPAIHGIARVVKVYPDPKASDPSWVFHDPKHTAEAPRWFNLDLEPLRPLKRPVTLSEIRSHGELAEMALLKQSRLSVQPVRQAEWDVILSLEDAPAPAPAAGKGAGKAASGMAGAAKASGSKKAKAGATEDPDSAGAGAGASSSSSSATASAASAAASSSESAPAKKRQRKA